MHTRIIHRHWVLGTILASLLNIIVMNILNLKAMINYCISKLILRGFLQMLMFLDLSKFKITIKKKKTIH